MFSFDNTEEKVSVRFEGEKDQDAIYEIQLCKYIDPENQLPIDPSIKFLCMAHPVWGIMERYRIKIVLKIILKGVAHYLSLLG